MRKRVRNFVGFGASAILIPMVLVVLAFSQLRTIQRNVTRITLDAMPSIYLIGKLESATLLHYALLTDHVDVDDAAGTDSGGPSATFAIAYIDLDEFKEVNDVYGHTSGDTFLRIAASRFRSVLRETDVLARIGGDEFIAVLGGLNDWQQAARCGRRLVESLDDPFVISDSLLLPCTQVLASPCFLKMAQISTI